MITSSEPTIARCRLAGGAIGKRTSARPRRTCVSLFMITGQRAALDADLGDRARLVLAVVVADDRDDVALLDREADVDDQRRVLEQIAVSTTVAITHLTLSAENSGQDFLREPLDLRELVDRAEPADEVVDAGLGERPDPLGDLVRRADRAPVREVHRLRELGVVLGDVVVERRCGPRPRSRRCSSSPGTRSRAARSRRRARRRSARSRRAARRAPRDAAHGSRSSSRRRTGRSGGRRRSRRRSITSGGASPFSRGFETTQIGGGVWIGISGAISVPGVERDVVVVEELARGSPSCPRSRAAGARRAPPRRACRGVT